jgi:hypothetical protein
MLLKITQNCFQTKKLSEISFHSHMHLLSIFQPFLKAGITWNACWKAQIAGQLDRSRIPKRKRRLILFSKCSR